MEQLIISFHTTAEAMRAEHIFREKNVPGRIVPVPPDIRADCGMAWRTDPENQENLLAALSGEVVPAGIYLRNFRY